MVGSTIYVGSLSYYAEEADVAEFFKGYGKIIRITIKRGFCFVEFEEYQDADRAIRELKGEQFILGRKVTVKKAREGRKRLPRRTKHQEKEERIYDAAYKPPKNDGVVGFESSRDMERASDELVETEQYRRPTRPLSRSSQCSDNSSDSGYVSPLPEETRHQGMPQRRGLKRHRDEIQLCSPSGESPPAKRHCSRSQYNKYSRLGSHDRNDQLNSEDECESETDCSRSSKFYDKCYFISNIR